MNKLKRYLCEKFITGSDFAEKIGVSRVTLYKYLGGTGCSLQVAKKIAEGTDFELSVKDIFFDRDEIPKKHLALANTHGFSEKVVK